MKTDGQIIFYFWHELIVVPEWEFGRETKDLWWFDAPGQQNKDNCCTTATVAKSKHAVTFSPFFFLPPDNKVIEHIDGPSVYIVFTSLHLHLTRSFDKLVY